MKCAIANNPAKFEAACGVVKSVQPGGRKLDVKKIAVAALIAMGMEMRDVKDVLKKDPTWTTEEVDAVDWTPDFTKTVADARLAGVRRACVDHGLCEFQLPPDYAALIEAAEPAPHVKDFCEIKHALERQIPAAAAAPAPAASESRPDIAARLRTQGLSLLTQAAVLLPELAAEIKAYVPRIPSHTPEVRLGRVRQARKGPELVSAPLVKKLNSLKNIVKDALRRLEKAGASDEELRPHRSEFGEKLSDMAEALLNVHAVETALNAAARDAARNASKPPAASPAASPNTPPPSLKSLKSPDSPNLYEFPASFATPADLIPLEALIKNLAALNRISADAVRLLEKSERRSKPARTNHNSPSLRGPGRTILPELAEY